MDNKYIFRISGNEHEEYFIKNSVSIYRNEVKERYRICSFNINLMHGQCGAAVIFNYDLTDRVISLHEASVTFKFFMDSVLNHNEESLDKYVTRKNFNVGTLLLSDVRGRRLDRVATYLGVPMVTKPFENPKTGSTIHMYEYREVLEDPIDKEKEDVK